MFGDKKNINILTSLLIAHGVRKAVVCPGSRNAPILHSLNECDGMTCYPVTDERSAGFYALGMSLADDNPVALCVTSGTALLNLAPAVAEATYRHHGLVIISADRPSAWIRQLDGQTLQAACRLLSILPEACSREWTEKHCVLLYFYGRISFPQGKSGRNCGTDGCGLPCCRQAHRKGGI